MEELYMYTEAYYYVIHVSVQSEYDIYSIKLSTRGGQIASVLIFWNFSVVEK